MANPKVELALAVPENAYEMKILRSDSVGSSAEVFRRACTSLERIISLDVSSRCKCVFARKNLSPSVYPLPVNLSQRKYLVPIGKTDYCQRNICNVCMPCSVRAMPDYIITVYNRPTKTSSMHAKQQLIVYAAHLHNQQSCVWCD